MSLPHDIPRVVTPDEYSQEERAFLIRLAHQAIEAKLAGRPVDDTPPNAHLTEPRGAFTTLYYDRRLRGCVGFIEAQHPLARTVAQTAISAAFSDPRFPPVTEDELPHLEVSISVLSPMRPIAAPEVIPGVHGLLISSGMRRGLLLPQVASEYGWDAATFLAQTCGKAGLPPDAWQHGATIEAFTAEIFGEVEEGFRRN